MALTILNIAAYIGFLVDVIIFRMIPLTITLTPSQKTVCISRFLMIYKLFSS